MTCETCFKKNENNNINKKNNNFILQQTKLKINERKATLALQNKVHKITSRNQLFKSKNLILFIPSLPSCQCV